jgi:hypothetical protein
MAEQSRTAHPGAGHPPAAPPPAGSPPVGSPPVGSPPASPPPAVVVSFAERLTGLVDRASGRRVRGAYLHGSAVLGGWRPDRSDVDALFVTEADLPPAIVTAVAQTLAAAAADCPGTGLECSVVTAGQARRPAAPWPFVLHVHASADAARVVRGDGPAGDEDLLMHYVVCRVAGWAVHGPPPQETIGAIPRPVILSYLADELAWGLENASEPYAVLNACRALAFAADGKIVSKIAGGRIALSRGLGPPAIVRRALDQQLGRRSEQAADAAAAAFVTATAAALRRGTRGLPD